MMYLDEQRRACRAVRFGGACLLRNILPGAHPSPRFAVTTVAVDDVQLPKGLAAIERLGVEGGAEFGELSVVAWWSEGPVLDVSANIEARIWFPCGVSEAEGNRHHSFGVPGYEVNAGTKVGDHPLVVEYAFEREYAGDV